MNDSTRLSIMPATEADVPLILHLVRGLAEYEKLLHTAEATQASLREALFNGQAVARVSLARLDGEAVGFASYFFTFSTFLGRRGLYLEDLFIEPPFRGRGFGKQLLGHVAKLAVEEGCKRLEWSALTWNKPAIDFYLSIGARQMDDWHMFRLTGEELARMAASTSAR